MSGFLQSCVHCFENQRSTIFVNIDILQIRMEFVHFASFRQADGNKCLALIFAEAVNYAKCGTKWTSRFSIPLNWTVFLAWQNITKKISSNWVFKSQWVLDWWVSCQLDQLRLLRIKKFRLNTKSHPRENTCPRGESAENSRICTCLFIHKSAQPALVIEKIIHYFFALRILSQ